MSKFLKILCAVFILLAPLVTRAQDAEYIASYHSDITVHADASMTVTETIRAVSAGQQIVHGIYRDFPIAYKDSRGQRYLVDFEILGVRRDGTPEDYHTERSGNGIRIYLGSKDITVPPGEHTYVLSYKTDRQLGFFSDHDELYWNVTGNGWVFPIRQASAAVTLPESVPQNRITAAVYTGRQGSSEQNAAWQIGKGGVVEFKTTEPLNSYEGLTIVVGWPKGYVAAPTAAQSFWSGVWANLDYLVGSLGFLLVLAYYIYFWNKRGRDPKKGSVVAWYESPRGLSPAMLRYVRRMGSDNRSFASALIDLAVKGKLKVTETEGGFLQKNTYTLEKLAAAPSALPEEEQVLEDGMFDKRETLTLDNKNASVISEVLQDFAASLKKQAGKQYFAKNLGTVALGFILSVAVFAATVAAALQVRYSVDSLLPLLFWPALFVGLFLVNALFGWFMRAYTAEGRKLMDEIEGFKLFLSVTEKDRLNFHNPPEKTPELFERMLPYALALDVEHQWSKQFADVFARLQKQGTPYVPLWYHGASLANFNTEAFAASIGDSFTGAVSSAATPPGSSSGFSGGSSGGGGGGGGGGGW